MKLVLQSFVIIISSFLVFVIVYTPASDFTGLILSVFISAFILQLIYRKVRKNTDLFIGSNFQIFLIITIILLLIFITEGINSSIFFLLYFLLFGITVMFEPAAIFVYVSSIILLFSQQALVTDIVANMFKLGSVILLSPLAYFFGREYRKKEKGQEKKLK